MFELILLFVVSICLILVIAYRFKMIKKQNDKPSPVRWLSLMIPFLLLILLLKSISFGSHKVITNSMLPSLEIGDLVLVNKLAYGVHSPISQKKIIETNTPKRGDVITFYWSEDNKTPQLKRVIGLPGDKIEYRTKQLFINDTIMPTRYYGAYEAPNNDTEFLILNEDIPTGDGSSFAYSSMILEYDQYLETDEDNIWMVPEGHYFVLGDNRDNSIDSQTQGFVPANNILGKASIVWFHWGTNIQFSRIGKPVTTSLAETSPE